jgi:hypothetical protein
VADTPRRPLLERLFGRPDPESPGHLWPRFLFLRALGLIFFSAFYSLAFQIHGLIGSQGILPVQSYLDRIVGALPGLQRFWFAPSLLWIDASDRALTALVAAGLASSVLLTLNVWPRVTAALSTLFFLSFVSTLQDFSSYQSDGMLLEAGTLAIFFAPRGLWPGLGATDPPSRASLFMLQWEWFRIYFESGVVKLASGDPQWRSLTAMDHYYENGPLPTWIGWYAQQELTHGFHAATALATLVIELGLVWLLFLPRRFRLACFLIVTPLQIGIILTANYAFLNYLVLALGVLLLDDQVFARLGLRVPRVDPAPLPRWRVGLSAAALVWLFYATVVSFPLVRSRNVASAPARILAPFRIANAYGLFAVMTRARYEIEFQGTADGRSWTPYRFRYKPQDPKEAPGIYAPYQPRFDWNLWFASLGPWQESLWVALAQARLLENSPDVLALFRSNPFPKAPPRAVRTVLWQYWFADPATRRATGRWWERREIGPFTGVVERGPDGKPLLKPAS